MVRVFLMLVALAVLVGACGETRTLSAGDEGASVSLARGDELQVRLEGNATTGFSWELVDYDPAVMAPRDEPHYEAVDTTLVGGGGAWTWTLSAEGPGECEVVFHYVRPWEDIPPEATFSFTASVAG